MEGARAEALRGERRWEGAAPDGVLPSAAPVEALPWVGEAWLAPGGELPSAAEWVWSWQWELFGVPHVEEGLSCGRPPRRHIRRAR